MKKHIEDIIRSILFVFVIYFTFSERKATMSCASQCRTFCESCTIGVFNTYTPEWTLCYW
jgi:hypothetical protein